MRPAIYNEARKEPMSMPNAARPPNVQRNEDGYLASFKEMLALVTRIYEASGQPDLKAMIDRAHAQLGRVPMR